MRIQKTSLLLLYCFSTAFCFAQKNTLKDRKDLQNLLEERKAKFESYTSSLEKRSGIFGNKTKKDLLKSNEVLIRIVQTDNNIINTLYRVIDVRNLETSNTKFDAAMQNQNYENLVRATDTLSKQVEALTLSNKTYKNKILKYTWLFFGMFSLVLWMIFKRWRKKV